MTSSVCGFFDVTSVNMCGQEQIYSQESQEDTEVAGICLRQHFPTLQRPLKLTKVYRVGALLN